MTATITVNKLFNNAIRVFSKYTTLPQYKAVQRLLVGIIEWETTVLQRMHKAADNPSAPSLRESLSYHLWNLEIESVIHSTAKKLIATSNRYKWNNIISWDWTDVFKPAAQKMENLKVVKDGSTGLFWNGYEAWWININGITHQFHLKDPNEEYIGDERRESMLKSSFTIIKPEETITVWDRGHDSVGFMDMLYELWTDFVIRAKKNRILKTKDWESRKCWTFECGVYEVELETWTSAYLYVVQKEWYKEPIRLYSSIYFECPEECVEIYGMRRRIEMDFKKMKGYGMEKVRVMSFKKIQNMCLLVQFIILLWQRLYNKIGKNMEKTTIKVALYYKQFCKVKDLTFNPSSVLRFVSEYLNVAKSRYPLSDIGYTLFWNPYQLKKLRGF
jgi:hypothetical protein